MFDLMPNQWTPVVPLTELRGNPVAAQVAGVPIVLFQPPGGDWSAFVDRCPHRSLPLSKGTVTREGTLRCAYHGWSFNTKGECTRVPLNELSAEKRAPLCARALPTRTLAGAVWVYTGAVADGEPVVPASLADRGAEYGTAHQVWDAHWTRAVENFIDFAHVPYVHQQSIGQYSHHAAEAGVVTRCELEERDFGFVSTHSMGGRGGFRFDWYRPNLTCLHFGGPEEAKLHVFSIPVDQRTTRVMTVRKLPRGVRQVDWERAHAADSHQVLDEDRHIVEAQPGPVALDGSERSVPSDAPTLAFRRWYRRHVVGIATIEGNRSQNVAAV